MGIIKFIVAWFGWGIIEFVDKIVLEFELGDRAHEFWFRIYGFGSRLEGWGCGPIEQEEGLM